MSALVARLERELGTGWVDVVEWLRSQNDVADIEAAIRAGRYSDVVTGIQEAAVRFAGDVHGAYNTAALQAREALDAKVPDSLINFDQTNTRAVRWAAQNRFDLRGQITRDQEDTIRSVIVRGQQEGTNPNEQARDIRQAIGLTAYQEQIVHNYRRELEQGDYMSALDRQLLDGRHARAIESAAAGRRSFSSDDVDRMTENYRQAWIGYRAETIARTEGLRAAHQGTDELYQQAIEAGQVNANELVMTWVAGPRTEDARPGHQALNDTEAPIGGVFTNPETGAQLRFPGDPNAPISETANCRCGRTVRYRPSTDAAKPPQDAPRAHRIEAAPEPERVRLVPQPPPAPEPEPILVAPEPPPAPEPDAERELARTALLEDRPSNLTPVSSDAKGVNSSYWVDLDGSSSGSKRAAIWKPQSGEASDMRTNIDDGTSYLREAAASNVADTLGVGDMVPKTVVRTFETSAYRQVPLNAEERVAAEARMVGWGDLEAPDYKLELVPPNKNTLPGEGRHEGLRGPGSLQEKAADASGMRAGVVFDQDGSERMRVFDFVTGNSDRHNGNVLVRTVDGKAMPVLIDNGLSFPMGTPDRFIQPTRYMHQDPRPLLPTTLGQIEAIDLETLATQLHESGIERDAVEGALQRAQAIKNDPSMLEMRTLSPNVNEWQDQTRMDKLVRSLPFPQRHAIGAILKKLYG